MTSLMYFLPGRGVLDLRCLIGDTNKDFIQLAIQGLADQVEVFQVHTLTQFMVHFVDGRGADAGLPGKVGLRPAKLALLSGQ